MHRRRTQIPQSNFSNQDKKCGTCVFVNKSFQTYFQTLVDQQLLITIGDQSIGLVDQWLIVSIENQDEKAFRD